MGLYRRRVAASLALVQGQASEAQAKRTGSNDACHANAYAANPTQHYENDSCQRILHYRLRLFLLNIRFHSLGEAPET